MITRRQRLSSFIDIHTLIRYITKIESRYLVCLGNWVTFIPCTKGVDVTMEQYIITVSAGFTVLIISALIRFIFRKSKIAQYIK